MKSSDIIEVIICICAIIALMPTFIDHSMDILTWDEWVERNRKS